MMPEPQEDLALGLDLGAVSRWVDDVAQVEGRLEFNRIGLGQSNLTIGVRDEGVGRWVLRRPPLGQLVASAHDVAREARILSSLERTAVPTPNVVALCQDPDVSPAPLLLMEHVDGLVIDRMPVAESVRPAVREGISASMVKSLAVIHSVDLTASGLVTLASHHPYAARQLRRWSSQWESVKTRELVALDRLTDTLRRSVPEQKETVLVHGDFHLRNVICSPASGSVRAVLDWELATLGDPIADLGTMLAYWPEPGDLPTSLFAASTLAGFRSRDELTDAYLSSTGRDGSAVTYWHALGLWKIAIICEGVLRRARDEPLNAAEDGAPDAEMVERLVERALMVLA